MNFCKTGDGKTWFWEIQKDAIDGKNAKKKRGQNTAIVHSPDTYLCYKEFPASEYWFEIADRGDL